MITYCEYLNIPNSSPIIRLSTKHTGQQHVLPVGYRDFGDVRRMGITAAVHWATLVTGRYHGDDVLSDVFGH